MRVEFVPQGFFRITDECVRFTRVSVINLIPMQNYVCLQQLKAEDRNVFYENKKRFERMEEETRISSLLEYREKIKQVYNKNFDSKRLFREQNLELLKEIITEGIQFKIIIVDQKSMIILYSQSDWFSYQNKLDTVKSSLLQQSYRVSLFSDLVDIHKILEISEHDFKFRGREHPQLEEIDLRQLERIKKKLDLITPSNVDTPDLFDAGYNFSIDDIVYNLKPTSISNPALQVIQGDNQQVHSWLKKHELTSNYHTMLVIGGPQPDGFKRLEIQQIRLDLLNFIRNEERSDYIQALQLIEIITGEKGFVNHLLEIMKIYIEDTMEEDRKKIDMKSFHEALSNLGEDYQSAVVRRVLAQFNYLDTLLPGELQLHQRSWIPMSYNPNDLLLLLPLLLQISDQFRGIHFLMINDHNLSNALTKPEIYKHLYDLLINRTTIFVSHSIFTPTFKGMDKLILKHNWSSKEYIKKSTQKFRERRNIDDLLVYSPCYITNKKVYWIDEIELPIKQYYGLSTELFIDHPLYMEFDRIKVPTTKQRERLEELHEDEELIVKEQIMLEDDDLPEDQADDQADEQADDQADEQTDEEGSNQEDNLDEHGDLIDYYLEVMGVNEYIQDYESKEKITSEKMAQELTEMISSLEVLFGVKYTLTDLVDESKFDKQIIDELIKSDFLDREVISDKESRIMLKPRGTEFINRLIQLVKNKRDEIREELNKLLPLLPTIMESKRKLGVKTSMGLIHAESMFLACATLNKSTRIDPMIMGFVAYFDTISVEDPKEFISYFDAVYLTRFNEIRRWCMKPQEEHEVGEVPRTGEKTTVKVEEEIGLQPIIRPKSTTVPYTSKTKIPNNPEGVDMTEMIEQLPKTDLPKPKKKLKKEPEMDVSKHEERLMRDGPYVDLITESPNRLIGNVLLLNARPDGEYAELINHMPVPQLRMNKKLREKLLSHKIYYVSDVLNINPDHLSLSSKQIQELLEFKNTLIEVMKDQARVGEILSKEGRFLYLSIGGYLPVKDWTSEVITRLPTDILDNITNKVNEAKSIDELIEVVYTELGKLLNLDVSHSRIDQHLTSMQRRNIKFLYSEFSVELKELSVSWLYSASVNGTELKEAQQGILNDFKNLHFNREIMENIIN
ncbi:MAG: hypothetical protein INQ03_09060 [Candidatus Heimdallarchaeota archaeon]|nr:hypothetical protein [Candidatus Heimdallarchaeota archaeon]